MYYTYLLQSKKDGRWYTGCTRDLRKRFNEHAKGNVFATKSRGPFELIYYEACTNEQDAYEREKYLKSGPGKRYLKNRLKRFRTLTGQDFSPLESGFQRKPLGRWRPRFLTGFTLIELLIVISVLSILALTITISVGSARMHARDTERKGAIKTLEAAAEQFWADERCYPNTTSSPIELNNVTHYVLHGENAPLKQALEPKYINPLPEDPRYENNQLFHPYQYESWKDTDGDGEANSQAHDPDPDCSGVAYRFVVYLENQGDPTLSDQFQDANGEKFLQLASPGWNGVPPAGNY